MTVRAIDAPADGGLQEDVAGLTDADLMEFIAAEGCDEEYGRAAWGEFYQRHARYVFRAVWGQYKGYGRPWVEDLVADTFLRARDKASTYDAHGINDPDRLRALTRGWLGRIAINLANDRIRGRSKPKEFLVDESFWLKRLEEAAPAPEEEPPSPRVAAASDAFAQLAEREREVLRVTAEHYGPDGKPHSMPPEALDALADTLGLTRASVRQLRKRAREKLEKAINDRLQGGGR